VREARLLDCWISADSCEELAGAHSSSFYFPVRE